MLALEQLEELDERIGLAIVTQDARVEGLIILRGELVQAVLSGPLDRASLEALLHRTGAIEERLHHWRRTIMSDVSAVRAHQAILANAR